MTGPEPTNDKECTMDLSREEIDRQKRELVLWGNAQRSAREQAARARAARVQAARELREEARRPDPPRRTVADALGATTLAEYRRKTGRS